MDVRRLLLLAQTGVPITFVEKKAIPKLKEALKEARKELSGKELEVVEEYVKNPPIITPPDVKGRRWSYYKAVEVINEYWRKVVETAKQNPEIRKELENAMGESVEDMKFNNYEVHYVLSMRTLPENLRSIRIILTLLLLKIAVEKGDIGRTGRGDIITHIADSYLSRVQGFDWKSIERALRKVLLD
ncbi:hypothetical protein [Hydrogenivirga sp.]